MKKQSLKLFLFFCVFLLQVGALFSAPVPRHGSIDGNMHIKPPYVPQKPADKPLDTPVRVLIHTQEEYCYTPKFTQNESYVALDKCSSGEALSARYDVFQRISWKFKGVWLCLTAPRSVTDRGETWDYLRLRPCVTNDENQRWIIIDKAIYTADKKYRVKDYKWYTYISTNKDDYYDHKLTGSMMDKWINTISVPGSISLKISIGWKFIAPYGRFDMYYISDTGPQSDVYNLYYNPESNQIGTYYASTGLMYCMVSQQSASEDWDWVKWKLCNDVIPIEKGKSYWDVSFLNGREGPILDYQGNLLRVTRYGHNWGVPYTAKTTYVEGDTRYSPTSEFVFPDDMQRWNRYVSGNLGDTLAYCPAPGYQKTVADASSKKRVKRTLPRDFQLNEQWIKRLHDIAISTDGTPVAVGICGTCLLHTYQMIAELEEYYPRGYPLEERGYFFDTRPNVNPFISLYTRYPLIDSIMRTAPRLYGIPLRPGETRDATSLRIAAATTQSILSRFDWRVSHVSASPSDVTSIIQQLLMADPGTIWIGLMTYLYDSGSVSAHAVPILRSRSGLIVIPTNTSMSLEAFRTSITETADPQTVLSRMIQGRQATIRSLAVLQLTGQEQRPLSVVMSQRNCTGDGDDRRGSRKFPRSTAVNQCDSGRCPF
ncbi:DUF1561 family protein [Bartonella sp. A05]|uniref:DUF1561 family protein n=1 Tax=Bartonella sp. A05 TaxID=2967261 RepID=UPI0022A98AE3|nr:DUF1561 family protein [Bartonella sp. A05]MCZ2204492.1 DUF1561 domain-containing protein [Bartonella sp. A05]